MNAIRDLHQLVQSLEPVQQPGCYVFTSVAAGALPPHESIVALIREREGISLIVAEETALAHALPIMMRCAWITLNVHSDLAAVGLTAAFAQALSAAQISCNVVAGAYHDHIFVPFDAADAALTALRQLQHTAH
jgi:hypothetical protein